MPLLPIVSALCCVGLMTNLAMETWLRFLVWLVVGLVIYGFYGRKHSSLRPAADDAGDHEAAEPAARSRSGGRRSSPRDPPRRPPSGHPPQLGQLQLLVERRRRRRCSIEVIHQEKCVHRQTRRRASSE